MEPPAPSCLLEEGSHNPRLLPACSVGGSCSWGHNYYLTSTGSGGSSSPLQTQPLVNVGNFMPLGPALPYVGPVLRSSDKENF